MTAPKAEKLAIAYKQVFDSPEGAVVLDDLIVEAGVLDPNLAGPEAGQWEHGRRSLGLYILKKLGWSASEIAAFERRATQQSIDNADQGGE